MTMLKLSRILAATCTTSMLLASGSAVADRSDGSKPMDFKSQSAHMDDLRKTYSYVSQVRMTQGTRQLTADKVVIKQDAAGFSKSVATGSAQKLAHIKQRENDGKGWMEAGPSVLNTMTGPTNSFSSTRRASKLRRMMPKVRSSFTTT